MLSPRAATGVDKGQHWEQWCYVPCLAAQHWVTGRAVDGLRVEHETRDKQFGEKIFRAKLKMSKQISLQHPKGSLMKIPFQREQKIFLKTSVFSYFYPCPAWRPGKGWSRGLKTLNGSIPAWRSRLPPSWPSWGMGWGGESMKEKMGTTPR